MLLSMLALLFDFIFRHADAAFLIIFLPLLIAADDYLMLIFFFALYCRFAIHLCTLMRQDANQYCSH